MWVEGVPLTVTLERDAGCRLGGVSLCLPLMHTGLQRALGLRPMAECVEAPCKQALHGTLSPYAP